MAAVDALVPVSVIGGYLGAGKTTLINSLLAGDHGRRLAVLINDFGSVNVDADLIVSHDGDTITLENGCVCCSIGDALGDAIDQVLALEPRPDQIVIEASGVADVSKVAVYGQGWPGCRLDAVAVLADVETIQQRAVDRFVGATVRRQLQAADVIIATKVDLVGESELASACAWLASTAPGSVVVPGTKGGIEPHGLLDLAYSTERPDLGPPAMMADEIFVTAHLATEGITRAALEQALDRWPPEVVRVKGFVQLVDAPDELGSLVEVQRVGTRWSIRESTTATPTLGVVVIAIRGQVEVAQLSW